MVKLGFIDLRKEIEILAGAVGFSWAALRSVDLSKPSTEAQASVPINYEQAAKDYLTLIGKYYYTDKLVRCLSRLAQPGFDFQSNIGNVNTKLRVYYLEYDKQPKETDFILELQLDEKTGTPTQPFKITRVWKIQDAERMRGGQPDSHPGRIDYWRCFVEENNFGYGAKST